MYLNKNLKNMFVCFCLNSLALKNLVNPNNGLGQVGQHWDCQHLGLDIRLFWECVYTGYPMQYSLYGVSYAIEDVNIVFDYPLKGDTSFPCHDS